VRVALVAETFCPAVNGVVNSVIRAAEALTARGHEALIVAPTGEPFRTHGGMLVDVVRVPATAVPGYRGLRIARPGTDLRPILRSLVPDVVHLASPAVLGWSAARAAAALNIPSVAVFQTDLSGVLRRYHLRALTPAVWWWLRRLHNRADLTLVPSSTTGYQLRRHGITTLGMWPRGVDGELFHPMRRDDRLRAELTGGALGATVVGFVGRLAAEKRIEALGPLSRLPGVHVVVVGDGPRRRALQRLMPDARFLGLRTGADLARLVASLDLVVHPGADETFCQAVQEALCSGVPVITAAAGGPLDLGFGTARTGGSGPAATPPSSPRRSPACARTGRRWRPRGSGPGPRSWAAPGTSSPSSCSPTTRG
jgi:phosphatidylinositol alpha 1,6-mannosyltransferase